MRSAASKISPLPNALRFSLRSVRVLDFGRYLPGPYCTWVLSRLGCRITKIELPHWPDPVRSMSGFSRGLFEFLHAGKKIEVFDYNKPAGRRRLLRMLRGSDVVVEGFRPGLMKRLGLDYDSLKSRYPRLIYCSITGYGQKGPRSRWAGHDLNYMAMSGLLSQGGPGKTPSLPPVQAADLSASLYAAIGILAALIQRRETGRGRHLDISMTQTARSLGVIPMAHILSGGRCPPGGSWWNGGHPFYRIYPCRDGNFVAVSALEKGSQRYLLDLLGLKSLEPLWEKLEKNGPRIQKELGRIFLRRTAGDWENLLADKDVCVTPVVSMEAALDF